MKRDRRLAAGPVLALVTLFLATPGVSSHASGAPGICLPAWTAVSTPNVGDGDNELVATSATSSTDVWAVGDYKDQAGVAHTLVQHWDGAAWSVIPSVDVPQVSSFLLAVDALSVTDAWAVGYSQDLGFPGGPARTLTEHWDGNAWTIVPSPNEGTNDDNILQGVKVISSGDAWAVGQGYIDGQQLALTLQWDGQAWSEVPGPNPSLHGDWLYAVDGTSSTDLWAVGYYFDGALDINQPLFAHWDGTAWTPYDFPGSEVSDIGLGAVAISSDDVWAVGTTDDPSSPGGFFTQHWDGADWSYQYAIPLDQGLENVLTGAAALSTNDVWMAGYYTDVDTGTVRTTILHWDGPPPPGTSPYLTPTVPPNIGNGNNKLGGITAAPADGELWAVGSYTDDSTGALRTLAMLDCPVLLGDQGFDPRRGKVNHPGARVGWLMASGTMDHHIEDPSGMGFFDSGVRSPPASYLVNFFAAGTYQVLDSVTDSIMAVSVPMEAHPREGGVSTKFRITWASRPARLGRFLFDVQIRRPGSTSFEDWKTGQEAAGSSFVSDAGPGTYSFRARLRNPNTGGTSGYSSPVSIQVS